MTCCAVQAQRQPSRQALDEWISTAEKSLVDAADAMPEEKYSFAPANGEFAGVRTFAQQVKHLAANNYGMSARIEGRKPAADQLSESGLGEDQGGDHGLSQGIIYRASQSDRND